MANQIKINADTPIRRYSDTLLLQHGGGRQNWIRREIRA